MQSVKSWSYPIRSQLALLLFLILGWTAQSQTPPDSEIFLIDLKTQAGPIGKPTNITQRKGYDNQPSFTPDGNSLLYTSMREDGQTDIYRYDLQSQVTVPLTQTAESEYSPTVTPDKAHFSVIWVEPDKTQRLWQFPLAGKGEPTLVLEHVKPVGYHCWLDADGLALFILGNPNSLVLARVSTGDTVRIAGSIGRTLLKVPGKNAVSFVYKQSPTDWEIRQLDLQTRQITSLTKTLEGSEDFVWTPDGTLLMGKGSVLYQCKPNGTSGWTPLADWSTAGIKQISRLAIDPQGTKLALVGQ